MRIKRVQWVCFLSHMGKHEHSFIPIIALTLLCLDPSPGFGQQLIGLLLRFPGFLFNVVTKNSLTVQFII